MGPFAYFHAVTFLLVYKLEIRRFRATFKGSFIIFANVLQCVIDCRYCGFVC